MTTTPPRTSMRVRTPPTPLHGAAYDNYEPYSPRRSKRSTAHSNPYSSFNSERSPKTHSLQRSTPPPTTVKKARFARAPTQLSSPPSSPSSPINQNRTLHKTPRKQVRVHGATASAHSDSEGNTSNSLFAPTSHIDPITMLPTPSKTPTNKKRPAAAIASASRVLNFQPSDPNDVMPSPRSIKKQRQHQRQRHHNTAATAGFELYDEDMGLDAGGGGGGRGRGEIEIYTDANARVPVLDESEDNPFIGRKKTGAGARPQQRRGGGRKSAEEVEREREMREAVQRDEGVVYVFRGKKILKRFTEDDNTDASAGEREASPDLSGTPEQRRLRRQAGAAAQRPLTRSAIKPRLLFPSEEQRLERERRANEVDEEAVTDIEMPSTSSRSNKRNAPRIEIDSGEITTPVEDSFTSATTATTPPSASPRASKKKAKKAGKAGVSYTDSPTQLAAAEVEEEDETLSSAEVANDSPNLSRKRKPRNSPFDTWQRTKADAVGSGVGRKRAGDAVEGEGGAAGGGGKRTRGAG